MFRSGGGCPTKIPSHQQKGMAVLWTMDEHALIEREKKPFKLTCQLSVQITRGTHLIKIFQQSLSACPLSAPIKKLWPPYTPPHPFWFFQNPLYNFEESSEIIFNSRRRRIKIFIKIKKRNTNFELIDLFKTCKNNQIIVY